MRISDWSSDVCSSDLRLTPQFGIVALFDRCEKGIHVDVDYFSRAAGALIHSFVIMPAGEQNSNMLADAIGDQIVDYARIRKGRRVTKIGHIALRDLAKDAPHDLAGTCLGQGRCKLNGVGGSDRADFLPHP